MEEHFQHIWEKLKCISAQGAEIDFESNSGLNKIIIGLNKHSKTISMHAF